ncbi:MAG: hypothetical protein LBV13_01205 [Methanomassiliicoccaceae archaeon]|jgi:hypothetical protein|nr:hypothetical protein [Methanomassiliicoccaceae archaeon]
MAKYIVTTKYDDGFMPAPKEFSSLGEAKSYFHNVDQQDIEYCTLCESVPAEDGSGEVLAEIARKDAKKK